MIDLHEGILDDEYGDYPEHKPWEEINGFKGAVSILVDYYKKRGLTAHRLGEALRSKALELAEEARK